MPNPDQNQEVKQPKKTVTESVDSLISKKKSEKEAEVSESAAAKMESTQGEVADVLGGMEKPSEKISEKAGEKGEKKGSTKGAATTKDDDVTQTDDSTIKKYTFPSDAVMIQRIRTAINIQIKLEMKKAKKYQGELTTGGAAKYNIAIAKVRALKHLLSSLFNSAAGFLKEMYMKYFNPNGRRRSVEDVF